MGKTGGHREEVEERKEEKENEFMQAYGRRVRHDEQERESKMMSVSKRRLKRGGQEQDCRQVGRRISLSLSFSFPHLSISLPTTFFSPSLSASGFPSLLFLEHVHCAGHWRVPPLALPRLLPSLLPLL